jgi:hypothetical protein
MRRIWLPVLAALVSIGATEIIQTDNILQTLFKCTGRTCVIRENLGGIPFLYALAAHKVRKDGIRVRVDGRCSSACVIFASVARKNVCITKNARMGIHQGRASDLYDPKGVKVDMEMEGYAGLYFNPPPGYEVREHYFIPQYGTDINEWALREGKMPATVETYVMTHEEALRFWRPCR